MVCWGEVEVEWAGHPYSLLFGGRVDGGWGAKKEWRGSNRLCRGYVLVLLAKLICKVLVLLGFPKATMLLQSVQDRRRGPGSKGRTSNPSFAKYSLTCPTVYS